MISVRECAKLAGLAGCEICLGASPSTRQNVLQSCYLLNLWRGPKAVRKLIVADIRRWIEWGAPDRAADAFLVLRQFLSDFPDAGAERALPSPFEVALRTRSQKVGRHRNQGRFRRRAFMPVSCLGPLGGGPQGRDLAPERPEPAACKLLHGGNQRDAAVARLGEGT